MGFVASILAGPCIELTPEQIQQLESQGNRCSNWSGIKLTGAPGTLTSTSSGNAQHYENYLERIRGCSFSGNVFIGVFLKNTTLERGVSVPSGLYNSNFAGTVILSDNCYVFNCSVVCNVFVGRNSSLVNCGVVTCEGQSSYGTQRTICIGPESDSSSSSLSRTVTLNVNSSYAEVCSQAMVPKARSNAQGGGGLGGADLHVVGVDNALMDANGGKGVANANVGAVGGGAGGNKGSSSARLTQAQHAYSAAQQQAAAQAAADVVRYDMTIICDDVEVSHCHVVSNAFIGSYSRVHASTFLNSTLLSHCSVVNAEVTDCVLHNSSSVSSKAVLHGVLMFPHSEVSNGAVVSESVLGPDSAVSLGECKRSLLGPFVGFHHSSLLISSTWPLGRGNIAHGCMIGKSIHVICMYQSIH